MATNGLAQVELLANLMYQAPEVVVSCVFGQVRDANSQVAFIIIVTTIWCGVAGRASLGGKFFCELLALRALESPVAVFTAVGALEASFALNHAVEF